MVETGLQWDMPNSWPPHQYIARGSVKPSEQPGHKRSSERQLLQPPAVWATRNSQGLAPLSVYQGKEQHGHGGGYQQVERNVVHGERRGQALERELANMHTVAAFYSWWAAGGSIPNDLLRRSDQGLTLTGSFNNTGHVRSCFTLFISSFRTLLWYAEHGLSRS